MSSGGILDIVVNLYNVKMWLPTGHLQKNLWPRVYCTYKFLSSLL